MNNLLWVLQILAALLYAASGVMKVFLFDKVSKAKSEDHDQFTQRNLVRILREGAH